MAEARAPEARVPDARMAEARIPEARVPEARVPEARVPEARVPEARVPEARVPETRVPETRVPETRVPETRVPETRVPETRVPETRVPEARTPETRVPLLAGVGEKVKRQRIPEGAITWRQGRLRKGPVWKYIAPPWTGVKPVTIFAPPLGALRIDETTAEATIQIIGKTTAVVPENISVDLGAFDIYISDSGHSIRFESGGKHTDVGKTLPSPTKGMSVDGGILEIDTETASARVRKPSISRKRKPTRRLYDNPLDTQLSGMR